MYTVDSRDRVIPLTDIPQSSVGAPLPVVVSDEDCAMVAYLLQIPLPPDWDGTTVRSVDLGSAEPGAVVRFDGVAAMYFGSPNDETFEGHPLAGRGLERYSASRVEGSSWIRRLVQMNQVHPYHRPEAFARLTHYILAFHDSIFECVAERHAVELTDTPLSETAVAMARRLARS